MNGAFDLARMVASLEGAFPAELVPRGRLHGWSCPLPGPAFAWGMVETRLVGRPDVDVLGCIDRPGHRAAAQPGVQALLAELPASLADRLPQLWLEWDQGRADPLVWWGVAARPAGAAAGPEDLLPPLLDAIRPADARRDGAITVARAVRGRGRVLGTGWLLPRGIPRQRMFVELGRGSLRGFLADVGWPGDVAPVARWWTRAVPPFEPGFLQLEIDDDGVGPYLGLEARQTRPGFPNRAWIASWLGALADAGLAEPERVAALLAWTGPCDVPLDGTCTTGPVLRSFHLKLSFAPGRTPEAKAYLGFTTAEAARRDRAG